MEILCRKGKIRVSDNGRILELYQTKTPKASTLSYSLDKSKIFRPRDSITLFTKGTEELAYADCDGLIILFQLTTV